MKLASSILIIELCMCLSITCPCVHVIIPILMIIIIQAIIIGIPVGVAEDYYTNACH